MLGNSASQNKTGKALRLRTGLFTDWMLQTQGLSGWGYCCPHKFMFVYMHQLYAIFVQHFFCSSLWFWYTSQMFLCSVLWRVSIGEFRVTPEIKLCAMQCCLCKSYSVVICSILGGQLATGTKSLVVEWLIVGRSDINCFANNWHADIVLTLNFWF